MVRDTLAMVREWHEAFDVPIAGAPITPDNRAKLRLALFEEKVAGFQPVKRTEEERKQEQQDRICASGLDQLCQAQETITSSERLAAWPASVAGRPATSMNLPRLNDSSDSRSAQVARASCARVTAPIGWKDGIGNPAA